MSGSRSTSKSACAPLNFGHRTVTCVPFTSMSTVVSLTCFFLQVVFFLVPAPNPMASPSSSISGCSTFFSSRFLCSLRPCRRVESDKVLFFFGLPQRICSSFQEEALNLKNSPCSSLDSTISSERRTGFLPSKEIWNALEIQAMLSTGCSQHSVLTLWTALCALPSLKPLDLIHLEPCSCNNPFGTIALTLPVCTSKGHISLPQSTQTQSNSKSAFHSSSTLPIHSSCSSQWCLVPQHFVLRMQKAMEHLLSRKRYNPHT